MDDLLPDDIVRDILARLPAKPLLRFRGVSKYWNRMLREPCFMNLRSRRTIILPLSETLILIDDNVPTDDTPHSVLKRFYPLANLRKINVIVRVIGTFNGIVLLGYMHKMILYNPFTGATKKLPCPPGSCTRPGYGFGYGATPDDLKIVRFVQSYHKCDVYSFKKNSWSSWSTLQYNIRCIYFQHSVGTFVNGFLHWLAYDSPKLIVLNVNDMVLSEMHGPVTQNLTEVVLLGTINGCLCSVNYLDNVYAFELWVMKEYSVEKSWSPIYSFRDDLNTPLCIFDNGRILMRSDSELTINDHSRKTYKKLNISVEVREEWHWHRMHVVEYMESLVAPSDMCCF
ncbi:F-box domain-containing protein [Artemisia annua]|uniref:F-box domain-containing protein n=1 Tax=Artemisia annua TaxID=35608 RepID=A0A2U1PWZ6_ARTAN|nr:F-box domain-containing protein [Artemisia annua]